MAGKGQEAMVVPQVLGVLVCPTRGPFSSPAQPSSTGSFSLSRPDTILPLATFSKQHHPPLSNCLQASQTVWAAPSSPFLHVFV